MTSPIVVQVDTELKEKAMKMAKKEGLTMKALLSFLLKGYTEQEIILTSRRRPSQ
jgi:antitoxin component of RelBE/YafQ-DinJ toxin-antitoxin module